MERNADANEDKYRKKIETNGNYKIKCKVSIIDHYSYSKERKMYTKAI